MGFEPTDACTSPVFKTGSFNHSDISPSPGSGQMQKKLYNTSPDLSMKNENIFFGGGLSVDGPHAEVEIGREADPQQIGQLQPGGRLVAGLEEQEHGQYQPPQGASHTSAKP